MPIDIGASIDLAWPAGTRTLAARDFYTADGIAKTEREPVETAVARLAAGR